MDYKLKGKIAIVTGASKGIGRGIAETLMAEGATVVMAARGRSELEAAAAALAPAGGAADPVMFDAMSQESMDTLVAHVRARYGVVDILVNNAGGITGGAYFDDTTDDDWRDTYELNVMSAVRLVRGLRPLFTRGAGRIVNISSENGIAPERAYPHYNAAKAALIALTKSLSKEVGDQGITVNCVSPGIIRTEGVVAGWEASAAPRGLGVEEMEHLFMHGRRRNVVRGTPGLPSEVGALVAFLCSEQAAFITGANYRIDGGQVSVC